MAAHSPSCPRCGALHSAKARFCRRCGLPLDQAAPGPAGRPRPSAPPAAEAAAAAARARSAAQAIQRFAQDPLELKAVPPARWQVVIGDALRPAKGAMPQPVAPGAAAPSVDRQEACPVCRSPLRPGIRVCERCGASLALQPGSPPAATSSSPPTPSGPRAAQPQAVCAQCGSPAGSAARYCLRCGAPLPQAQATPMSCPQCRRPVRPGARFCEGCGRPVS